MRINNLQLRFLDGKQVVHNYTTPGWYLIATDADQDDCLWVVEPMKLSPDMATQIATMVAEIAKVPVVFAGVRNQNIHAANEARLASQRAHALAEQASKRDAELAQWDAAIGQATTTDSETNGT